jgi:hypothetical protein
MILAMDVLRWLTLRVLADKTWAEDRIEDSPSQPSDLRAIEDQAPFIAVYTDQADINVEEGNSLAGGEAKVFLILECAVGGAAVTIQDPAENQRTDSDADAAVPPLQIEPTDQGREMTIGFLARQANQAFLATDNQWATLWRQLVAKRISVRVRRGGAPMNQDQPAIRFASRILIYEVEVLDDPIWGEPLQGFWLDFVNAISTDRDFAPVAALIRAQIEYPAGPLPSWRIAQKIMTLNRDEVAALGIAPVVIPDETEAPMVHVGTVHDENDEESWVRTDEDDADVDSPTQIPILPLETFVEQPEIVDETPEEER